MPGHDQEDINPETPRAVQHFEIATDDPDATRGVLERVFGWEFRTNSMPDGSRYDTFRMPDGTGGGVSTPQGYDAKIVPYINVEDIDRALERVKAEGAEIVLPTKEVPGMGRYFWFSVHGGPPLGCWQPED